MLNILALVIWTVLAIILLFGVRTKRIYNECCKVAEEIINEELQEKP